MRKGSGRSQRTTFGHRRRSGACGLPPTSTEILRCVPPLLPTLLPIRRDLRTRLGLIVKRGWRQRPDERPCATPLTSLNRRFKIMREVPDCPRARRSGCRHSRRHDGPLPPGQQQLPAPGLNLELPLLPATSHRDLPSDLSRVATSVRTQAATRGQFSPGADTARIGRRSYADAFTSVASTWSCVSNEQSICFNCADGMVRCRYAWTCR
jgi:hypothetical protein